VENAITVDAITTEIIRATLNSAAEEMNATLIRSAYTPVIYEIKDCAVALLDDNHRILGQSSGVPLFLGNLEVVTELTEQIYGREVWQPGDVWVLNDSYMAGTHLHDMTAYGPVFVDDELVGFAACRAHWLDVGGKNVGSSSDTTDIYQEGLRVGGLKVVEGGRQRPDVVDLLTRNSRFSYPARGDLFAQIACLVTGQKRLSAIVRKFGLEVLRAARDEIYTQTERFEREVVTGIPDGTYESEGCIDNDGVEDTPKWVRVRVVVSGDEMTIDLTGTDDIARGPVNCGVAQAVSAARMAFKLLVNPDKPVDGGSFRPLDVKVREGSMLAAVEPAPCEWYFSSLGLLIDLVVKALAPVLPERVAGASYGDSMVIGINGTDPRTGRSFLLYEATVGGWGAWAGGDAQDGLINSVNGALKDMAMEVLETKYPIHMLCYRFRTDCGGAGTWRGGTGVERQYVVEADDAQLMLWFERSKMPAWGLLGGHDGTPPQVVINEGRPGARSMLKIVAAPLERGDIVTTRTGGGGGYGDPRERSRDLVVRDLRNGFVSEEAARSIYGYEA